MWKDGHGGRARFCSSLNPGLPQREQKSDLAQSSPSKPAFGSAPAEAAAAFASATCACCGLHPPEPRVRELGRED